jgi:hypothetical protein
MGGEGEKLAEKEGVSLKVKGLGVLNAGICFFPFALNLFP